MNPITAQTRARILETCPQSWIVESRLAEPHDTILQFRVWQEREKAWQELVEWARDSHEETLQ